MAELANVGSLRFEGYGDGDCVRVLHSSFSTSEVSHLINERAAKASKQNEPVIIAMMPKKVVDRDVLEAALIGFQHQREQIDAKIAEVRAHLSGAAKKEPSAAGGTKKRVLSSAARKRIAVAQKKRWANARKQATIGTSGTGPRRGQ
jgi:hypothetical protein